MLITEKVMINVYFDHDRQFYDEKSYYTGVWKLLSYGFKEDNLKWNLITPKKDEKILFVLKVYSFSKRRTYFRNVINETRRISEYEFDDRQRRRIS